MEAVGSLFCSPGWPGEDPSPAVTVMVANALQLLPSQIALH